MIEKDRVQRSPDHTVGHNTHPAQINFIISTSVTQVPYLDGAMVGANFPKCSKFAHKVILIEQLCWDIKTWSYPLHYLVPGIYIIK